MEKIAVIGLGRFGSAVAAQLAKAKFEVVVIDVDERLVDAAADKASHALILDATDKNALLEAGLNGFQTVIVGIGEQIQASILATLLLKEIGVPRVIARALDDYHGMILERIGADMIVFPEQEMGVKLAKMIANPGLIDFMELGSDYTISEYQAPDGVVGRTLANLHLRKDYGINVVAIQRGARILGAPGPDDTIEAGDVLIVSGSPENIARLKKL